MAFFEAEETLDHLDEKIIELNNLGKLLLEKEIQGDTEEIQKQLHEVLIDATLAEFTYDDIQGEIEAITLSQSLLETKLENTRKEIDKLHEIQAVQTKKEEQEQNLKPKI